MTWLPRMVNGRPTRRRRLLGGFEVLEPRDVPAAGWQDLPAIPPSAGGATAYLHPSQFRAFDVNPAEMRAVLAQAPDDTGRIGSDALVLVLPGPDGRAQRFAVVDAPIMAPELAAQFPDIETFRGQGLDDPTATLRLDLTPLGLHAQVLAAGGAWYIDPYYHLEADGPHISYARSALAADGVYPLFADGSVGPAHRPGVASADVAGNGEPRCGCLLCQGLTDLVAHDGQLPAPDGYPQAPAAVVADRQAVKADVPVPVEAAPAGWGTDAGDGDGGGGGGTANRSGTQLRTYRTAVAATGEYTTFFGGTVANGQAAIVTAMNRVSGVYEVELSIRMTLVANNSLLVYTNAATDPYDNLDGFAMLAQNQTNVNAVIGNANYDIGHVFSTGGGGVASLGSVGVSARKAQGVTGLPSPVGDAFTIDFVAHEMGHQYGGSHTFNTSADPQRSALSAYEPGSGSTIQAYAGIIGGGEDLQNFSDAYFHSRSFDQMIAHVDVTIPAVGTRTATGNTVPTVSAGADFVIPAQTPFVLTATGSDANGDTLTFNWEQRNLGAARLLSDPDNGASPLFRSWTATTNPSRTFPRLSNLVANTLPIGEKLPTVNWTAMNFRVTARDNRSGGGGVNTDDMSVQVVATGAAFAVTAPTSTGVTWTGTTAQTVTWNVAGTAAAPISAANVTISLSTDGGLTYPTVLAASEVNDGSATITVPNVASTQARVRVQAVGNIFFDISNNNFTIARVPVVESVAINAAAIQRSRLTTVAVTFDTTVAVGAGAFKLTRVGLPNGGAGDDAEIASGGASPQITFTTATVAGKTVATLSFNGTGVVQAGSLADGVWRLTVVGTAVTLGGTAMPADTVTPTTGASRIYRLFGDADGDGDVDSTNFLAARVALDSTLAGGSPYNPAFDIDGDGDIDSTDYLGVRVRLDFTI